MLNPCFSTRIARSIGLEYVLPDEIAKLVRQTNTSTNTHSEFRLQRVYQNEIWLKLQSLGLGSGDYAGWASSKILDVCCGTGFLSYHLLSVVQPQEIILNEISIDELIRARELMQTLSLRIQSTCKLRFLLADILQSGLPDNSFDIVIGNSFLHHFVDVPYALAEFWRLLRPGGMFITLHEPTVPAVAIESFNPRWLLRYLIQGDQYMDHLRYKGDGIRPGGGSDVWVFRISDLVKIVKASGFANVVISNWHLFRQLIAAGMRLLLSEKKPSLNLREEVCLESGIILDSILNRFAPAYLFGSCCLLARKPM